MQCGFAKHSKEDLDFRKAYEKILDGFIARAHADCPQGTLFKDLKLIYADYINANLYSPVCNLVASTINNLCKKECSVKHLLNFLLGSTHYYKIMDFEDEVRIMDFSSLPAPQKVKATVDGCSYVKLVFSNGFVIAMRLHTASSRLGRSLKFDSQPVRLPGLVEEVLAK